MKSFASNLKKESQVRKTLIGWHALPVAFYFLKMLREKFTQLPLSHFPAYPLSFLRDFIRIDSVAKAITWRYMVWCRSDMDFHTYDRLRHVPLVLWLELLGLSTEKWLIYPSPENRNHQLWTPSRWNWLMTVCKSSKKQKTQNIVRWIFRKQVEDQN